MSIKRKQPVERWQPLGTPEQVAALQRLCKGAGLHRKTPFPQAAFDELGVRDFDELVDIVSFAAHRLPHTSSSLAILNALAIDGYPGDELKDRRAALAKALDVSTKTVTRLEHEGAVHMVDAMVRLWDFSDATTLAGEVLSASAWAYRHTAEYNLSPAVTELLVSAANIFINDVRSVWLTDEGVFDDAGRARVRRLGFESLRAELSDV